MLKNKLKGMLGETKVRLLLYARLPSSYHTLHNITLPAHKSSNVNKTQIDHIVISKYGVFVIETKNMSGKITGKQRDKYWTQVINKQDYRFQNPLLQNYAHVKAVQQLTGLQSGKIISVIIFIKGNSCTKRLANVCTPVAGIKFIKKHKDTLLTSAQVKKATKAIKSKSK
jgi:restriction system protein